MAVPAAPNTLVATPGDTSVSIAFVQDVADPVVTNYKYSLDSAAAVALDPADDASPVVIEGLTNGTEYSITLFAVNADGDSLESDPVLATPSTVPAAPVVTPTAGDNQVSLAFTIDDGGSPITDIEYNVDRDGWVSSGGAATPVVVTGLPNDIEVSIELRGVNANGAGAVSSEAVATPTDADLTNNNGFTDATVFANPGAPVPNLDWNDPDD